MGRHARILSSALLLLSCGIFSPRPVEYPSGKPTVEDQFKFASLLDGTGKKFNKLGYEDLFNDNMSYIDINGNVYRKAAMISNLRNVEKQFSLREVSWNATSIGDVLLGETLYIDREYHVVAADTLAVPQKVDTFDNHATFKIIQDSVKNTLTIFEWKDIYAGYSIFHPLFLQGN